MSREAEGPFLDEVIDRLSDGLAVDWSTPRRLASDDEEAALLRALEAIDKIGRAHRPETWEHLEILEPVAAGAHGEVFRAWDGNLEREVALKLLYPQEHDHTWNSTALDEGRLLAKVKHWNVVEVYGAVERNGRVGIWMEYVKGRTLAERLRAHGPFDWKSAAVIGIDVCRAVAAVHEKKLVHRDIKAQNIMQEEGGRILLVDFGIGHHQNPVGFEPAMAGTPLYAAPELFTEDRATAQSDIYSMGVLLYHLVTGAFPVSGDSAREIAGAHERGESSLLRDVAPSIPAGFVEIVERALARDPDERYRSAGQMERALSDVLARPSPKRRGIPGGAAALFVSMLTALVLWIVVDVRIPGLELEPSTPPTTPTVAVLLFHNRTGDPSADWLRLGLTELLVTDLAQSPHLRVVSTDEVYRLVEDEGQLPEVVSAPELVTKVAEQTRASTVVVGSYFKAGEAIRLSAQIQDVGSGEVVAELVEGVGEASLFQMVDELSSRVHAAILVSPQDVASFDRELVHVSTASSEAFRHYVEGIGLQFRGQLEQAIPLLERAVAIDPGFALAHAKLSLLHMHTGRDETAMAYSRLALDHVDRVSERERFYIVGNHYSWRESTYHRAIESYREGFARYPDFALTRHNEAILQWDLGEYDDAIAAFEALRRDRPELRQLYRPLALSYAARNEFERGRLVLLDLVQTGINDAYAYRELGDLLTVWGRTEDAVEAYQAARVASPRTVDLDESLWRVFLLEEDWDALAAWRERVETSEPSPSLEHAFEKALTSLYRGRGNDAVRELTQAASAAPETSTRTAAARWWAAHVLLAMGQPARAIETAELAILDGEGDVSEWEALFTTARAHATLGEWDEARRAAEAMEAKSASVPGPIPSIRNHWLAGELALLRGDGVRALSELDEAAALLPRRGIFTGFIRRPYHVPVWYAMASAYAADGDDAAAYELFTAIVSSPSERLVWPILYVRSYWRLAQIDARRGDDERAREHFARFLAHWSDGDIDGEKVREARTWLN